LVTGQEIIQGVATGGPLQLFLVIIATTSRFRDVADDIQRAVKAGSNVLVSAEECANPWLVDPLLADRINTLAEDQDVTVLGSGLNPGLIFDALVLTLLGATPGGVQVEVTRIVDIGHFGSAVLRRLGIGFDESAFRHRVDRGEVLGHAGFPQSISIVAQALHVAIDGITEEIDPIFSDDIVVLPNGEALPAGTSVGIVQTYRASIDDHVWFTAVFRGHVRPDLIGWEPQDTIEFMRDGRCERSITITPGLPSQSGSQAMIANSVDRVLSARPGWLTVADLPPAFGHHS
jgi:4-hydroxy-tetrahydrodipicolinate reductase